tara:strand:- start:2 stop:1249 length:1248 start_codon:yes stop_codon:yes gene_type:complete
MAKVNKRHITPAPADGYAAFYYEWLNTTTDMRYGGKHNGYVDDGYSHSSQNPKMHDDFQNMEHKWKYSVLHYGSEKDITNIERKILKSNEARTNPKWYNLNNGGTAFDESLNSKIKFICEEIQKGKWLQPDKLNKFQIQELLDGGIQVRINSSDPKFTKEIETLIDDKGDTSNTNPLVLVEDKDGNRRLINGNTTGQATIDSKHGLTLQYQVIPFEFVNTFKKNDFRGLGLALNPADKIPTSPSNVPDAVAYVMEGYRNGLRDIRHNSNVEYLRDILNFNSKKRDSVFKEVEAQIKSGNATNTTPIIRYAQKAYKYKLKERADELGGTLTDTKIFKYASNMIRYGDICNELASNDNRGRTNSDKFSNIMLLIHFSSYAAAADWDDRRSKIDRTILKSLCSKYGLSFSGFEYMSKF